MQEERSYEFYFAPFMCLLAAVAFSLIFGPNTIALCTSFILSVISILLFFRVCYYKLKHKKSVFNFFQFVAYALSGIFSILYLLLVFRLIGDKLF